MTPAQHSPRPSSAAPSAAERSPIPRVIHQIWLGPNPLPEEFQRYRETWKRHHPDWEIRLWTDAEVAELDLPEAFHRGRDVCEKADVLRMELIRRFGGLHVDTDIECLRPLDPLLEGLRAFAGYDDINDTVISGALMGAVPEHPALERAVREVHDSVGSGHIIDATGPRFLTRIFAEDPELLAFPHEYFHPRNFRASLNSEGEFPDAYTIHHWSHLWMTPEESRERLANKTRRIERLKTNLARARRRERAMGKRIEELERRIAAMERSRWWRLGGRLRAARRGLGRLPGRR